MYKKLLKKNQYIETPKSRDKSFHTYHQFVIKVKRDRNLLIDFLKKKKIETAIHYPRMLINLKPYKVYKFGKDFSNCLNYEKQILSLPIHPFLTKKEIEYISSSINLFFKR